MNCAGRTSARRGRADAGPRGLSAWLVTVRSCAALCAVAIGATSAVAGDQDIYVRATNCPGEYGHPGADLAVISQFVPIETKEGDYALPTEGFTLPGLRRLLDAGEACSVRDFRRLPSPRFRSRMPLFTSFRPDSGPRRARPRAFR